MGDARRRRRQVEPTDDWEQLKLLRLRTFLVALPFASTGVPLVVYGSVFIYLSMDRVQGLLYYSRHIAVGMLLLGVGVLAVFALRRADARR